jgi:putative pyruvate formate lyase activating enzyme
MIPENTVATRCAAVGVERLELARRHYRCCRLCAHCCGVDRLKGERGFCGAGAQARVYCQRVECGDESDLIPSHLLYLSGCNLRCAFCICEAAAFDPQRGTVLSARSFEGMLSDGRSRGARTLQWAGGEPTIHLPAILEVMARGEHLPPVVWKSNLFATPEALALLDGAVDVHVADLKFGNNACARRIAGVDGYLETVTRNLLLLAKARLIIRHLLLPGHFDCCYRPILDWVSRWLPGAPFRIMVGYLPRWEAARCRELAGPLDRGSGRQAANLAAEKGLKVLV